MFLRESRVFFKTLHLFNHVQRKLIHNSIYNASQVSFKLSDIGEGIREVIVKEWFVKIGDKVSQFDEICEVQSDKASVTITSRYDGIIKKLHYQIDQTALVGQPLVDIETEETEQETAPEEAVEKVTTPEEVPKVGLNGGLICIPSVRRLAKEHNLDLSIIQGSGREGRILKEDVLRYLNRKPEAPTAGVQSVPIKGFQKAMVKTMTAALKIPHFVYGDEIKVTNLSEVRRTLRESDLKLSLMPFFVKAVSQALHRYPIINSSVDDACENITQHKEHNIGIAMDTKAGLAVPVIKNVQRLSILEIHSELKRLIATGREGNFTLTDLSGGTFSVSNIGAIGGTYMTPVIMPPHVALIALGSSQVLPRFDAKNTVVAEEILNISGVADHRVIDGATMARFVQSIKQQIEKPYLLFLNL